MNRLELRKWRRERYLTQAALAELLGVRTNTVARWESGNHDLPSFLKLALERLDDLYEWTPDAAEAVA